MQLLATPLLYRHMEVDCFRLEHSFGEATVKEHPGLKHIRILRIRMNFLSHLIQGGTIMPICRVLVNIPKHTLTQFEYGIHVIFDFFPLHLDTNMITDCQCTVSTTPVSNI